MSDVVLILLSVIFAGVILVASVYFLVYFQHPEDKNVAWFPKGVVVSVPTFSKKRNENRSSIFFQFKLQEEKGVKSQISLPSF